MNKRIHIVMSYCNRKAQTINTLQSINKSKYTNNVNVIIVDDCSKDTEQLNDIINDYNFSVTILPVTKDKKNWHNPCVTYNYGFIHTQAQDGDIIIIQNPECTHNGDIIEYCLNNTTDENYVVFNCASLDKQQTDDYIKTNCFKSSNIIDNASDVNSYDGHVTWYVHKKYRPKPYHFCSSITYKNLKKLNGFDLDFRSGHGFDDDEIILRIKNLNLKINYVDDPHVYHLWHERAPIDVNIINKYRRNEKIFFEKKKLTNYTANNNTFFGKKNK